VLPWEDIDSASAPDGTRLELRRRGREYLILAGGYDLMSSEDEGSSRALADLGCAHLEGARTARVLVGGLGMGYTLRAALDRVGPKAVVEVAELVPAVAEWNRGALGSLAGNPLADERAQLHIEDVGVRIRAARASYDAILLDVDNGPDALAHAGNEALYGRRGLAEAWTALRPGGVFGVWSFSDDARFTERLARQGFEVQVHRVKGSRKGRGRHHRIWVARRPGD
jgi:spermidine synthase